MKNDHKKFMKGSNFEQMALNVVKSCFTSFLTILDQFYAKSLSFEAVFVDFAHTGKISKYDGSSTQQILRGF